MNTQDLAAKLEGVGGLNKGDARKAVQATFDAIAEALAAGEEVNLPGFGKFTVKHTAAREGRNPATGATIAIPAGKKPAFSAGKGLKDRVAG
jgi:DNA-binding protein HU-beta